MSEREPGRVSSPPQHDGPCEESLDGDGKPLGYCVVCYQPMPGRVTPPTDWYGEPITVERLHRLGRVGLLIGFMLGAGVATIACRWLT